MVAIPLLFAAFAGSAMAVPIQGEEISQRAIFKQSAWFLAGDSTTATTGVSGGGWGNGFLTTIRNGSFGMNYGHNGATTASFVAGGDWGRVLAKVVQARSLEYEPYVTIQFGHNDQKNTSGITIEEFSTNLKNMALNVTAAGGTPILVTSITRRTFNSSGLVIEDLAPQAAATIAVAEELGAHFIDLNHASTVYVDAIGNASATTYNLIPTDFTHLNAHASMLFGNMVAELLSERSRDQTTFLKYNSTIVHDINVGEYIFPSLPSTPWVNSTAPAEFVVEVISNQT